MGAAVQTSLPTVHLSQRDSDMNWRRKIQIANISHRERYEHGKEKNTNTSHRDRERYELEKKKYKLPISLTERLI